MIQYLTLLGVEPYTYRSGEGCGLKLRFDGQDGLPSFGYVHQPSEDQVEHWTARIGEPIAVRTKLRMHRNGIYKHIVPFDGFRRK